MDRELRESAKKMRDRRTKHKEKHTRTHEKEKKKRKVRNKLINWFKERNYCVYFKRN